jgi:hypothetical protein
MLPQLRGLGSRSSRLGGVDPHDALVLLTTDHNEIDKLMRESSVPQDHVRKPKEYAVEIATSAAISRARMRERMSLSGGIR